MLIKLSVEKFFFFKILANNLGSSVPMLSKKIFRRLHGWKKSLRIHNILNQYKAYRNPKFHQLIKRKIGIEQSGTHLADNFISLSKFEQEYTIMEKIISSNYMRTVRKLQSESAEHCNSTRILSRSFSKCWVSNSVSMCGNAKNLNVQRAAARAAAFVQAACIAQQSARGRQLKKPTKWDTFCNRVL